VVSWGNGYRQTGYVAEVDLRWRGTCGNKEECAVVVLKDFSAEGVETLAREEQKDINELLNRTMNQPKKGSRLVARLS
jgi:hypothetical protein